MNMRYRHFFISILGGFLGGFMFYIVLQTNNCISTVYKLKSVDYRRRPECTCSRPELVLSLNKSSDIYKDTSMSFCSHYATQRGPHQRVIAISLFGPKERQRFLLTQSLNYLRQLIEDFYRIYPDNFILRIYHDDTINYSEVICPIECIHPKIDFCNMKSKLFIPPKIWRFLPAGDPLVDIMMSRDLDSAFTKRERAAVNKWLKSGKAFHAMRDHPRHRLRMLGGLWGFRPALNRSLAHTILEKMHTPHLIKIYRGVADQTFLTDHVWPYAKANALVHDSFHCEYDFGHKAVPFPTQRPSANETNCFVGCVRPCCGHGKMPFQECPVNCRPKHHPEWIYC